LRQRLGSRDFRQQVAAREIVAAQGARAVRFIAESAQPDPVPSVEDRSLLLFNLMQALTQIEVNERRSFPQLWLALALASYELNDFSSAASAFRRVDTVSLDAQPESWYYRGYAFHQAGLLREALASARSYTQRARTNEARAAGHSLAALVYDDLRLADSAVSEYRRALRYYPDYPAVQNNLAYLLAEQNWRLDEALSLVNRALSEDSENGHYLDTKAWVLYRMRRYQEALPLAERAAARLPNNPEVRRHLEEIRQKAASP
jgi:tetratricopeptide (TPR) repeat protein